jgi:hypothetical protein
VASQAAAEPEHVPPSSLSVSAYIAELDRLLRATRALDDYPQRVSELATELPVAWRVQTDQRTFDISTKWLRRDLDEWLARHHPARLGRVAEGLQALREEAASLQEPAVDVSGERGLLARILTGREFHGVHGPTLIDRLKQRALQFLFELLRHLFRASAIPTIGRVLVDGLIGLAVVMLAFWMYHTLRGAAAIDTVLPGPIPVSARAWTAWLTDARAAADSGNWRASVHLAYWCSIAFLEEQGVWRPDRARTPREYLQLLSSRSEYVPTLTALTRCCELVWYGTDDADAETFAQALAHLRKLGCPST